MSFAEAVSESWLTRGKYLDLTRATCLLLYLYLTHVWTKIHTHTHTSVTAPPQRRVSPWRRGGASGDVCVRCVWPVAAKPRPCGSFLTASSTLEPSERLAGARGAVLHPHQDHGKKEKMKISDFMFSQDSRRRPTRLHSK